MIHTPRIGDVIGTNCGIGPSLYNPLRGLLGGLITIRSAGIGKVTSPHITQHIVLVARWERYCEDIVDSAELRYGCEIPYPRVDYGTYLGVEATWPRARWTLLSRYAGGLAGNHVVFHARPRYSADDDLLNGFLWNYVGRRYDIRGLFESIGCGNDDPKRSYCSEIARDAGKSFGCGYPPEWKYGVSPYDFQKHFEATREMLYRSYKKWWG